MLASLHPERAEGQRELGSPHTPRRREVALREREHIKAHHYIAFSQYGFCIVRCFFIEFKGLTACRNMGEGMVREFNLPGQKLWQPTAKSGLQLLRLEVDSCFLGTTCIDQDKIC